MKLVRFCFAVHLVFLLFGLAGLLVALPHPELWSGSPLLRPIFLYGMAQGGASQMLVGAVVMVAFGVTVIGWRKTLVFFFASTAISLTAELIGTSTGWPFGAYSYTEGLGPKILGRVPYTVPLSWFYMGLASYLLASALLARRRRPWAPVATGAALLTTWDLVLDPAMASPALPVQFWVWHETGPYFGMPAQNLVGWTVTGLVFMAISRVLWQEDAQLEPKQLWLPLAVYTANLGFAVALSWSVGLWQATIAALALGLTPAVYAVYRAMSVWRTSPWPAGV